MRFSSHYAEWIDDVTRVRALKVYKRHTQATSINAINFIDFIDYVVEKWDSTTRVGRMSNPRLHSHDRAVRASEYRTL